MIRRREALLLAAASALRAEPGISRKVFLKSPGKGTAVMAYAFYTKSKDGDMMSIEQRWSRSDTIDISYIRLSSDNGRTWGEPKAVPTGEKRPTGTWRKHPRAGIVDPRTGRYLEFWNEAVLPSDDPLEGMRQWGLYYRTGLDGKPIPVIHEGREFNENHPIPGVFRGKNAVMLGDVASVPFLARDGSILLPLEISPLGPDGKYYNPTGGYTYTDAAILHGQWRGDKLSWKLSSYIKGDPAKSTRGMVEPTIAQLDDGRLMVVMRGSNDKRHDLPSYRWVCFSSDGGWQFTPPKPWTFDSGDAFFSPSSCSQLIKHSSGKLFWLGNITPHNPKGNRPRYPFVIAEVDRASGLLKKNSLRTVDDRQPGEHEILTLSNFYAREDRETREIVLHMTRLFALPDGWEGDAMEYRITI